MSRLWVFISLALMPVAACGGDAAAAPEFPRAFTAVTVSCSVTLGLQVDSESGTYVETMLFQTVHASTEQLFPRRICFLISSVLSLGGELLEEDVDALPCPNEAGELEGGNVNIEASPDEWHFTGTGRADGRSIEFLMEPLFEVCEPGDCQCGFATTGTIR